MTEKLISIVVPVYKVEQYLDRCVDSIVNQTYKNLEIILVDDGSPDNCPQMCDEWAKKDNRIKVIHKENGGLANARNTGIDICTGDYVLFVDSDDYIESDMVEFLLKLSLENDADVSRCGFYFDYSDGRDVSQFTDCSIKFLDKTEAIIDLATSGFGGTAWNKLYKKDIIKTHLYDKSDGCSEDIMHNFRVYQDVSKIVFCDEPKYHYVLRKNSITNNTFGHGAFDIIRAKKKIIDYAKDFSEIMPYAVKGYIISAYIVLSGCIQNNAFKDDKNKLIKSILKYKKEIYTSSLYSKSYKIRTFILSVSPKFYSFLIKNKYRRIN